jgi:hypothetical protein
MTSRCRSAVGLSIALLLPFLPAISRADSFSSSVERFEADGNEFGSVGGALDLVDEFDDGVLAPNWAPLLGTATEAGGKLTLHDPGVVVPLVGLPQELSVVEATTDVANGEGNFTLTSYWNPTALPTNRQFFFQLYGVSPVIEAEGVTVNNLDAAAAASTGAPVGYSIGIERVFPVGNQLPPVSSYVSINPASITGQIVLRMAFDDATDLLTFSFSLDGGATFQSPFAPLQAFVLTPDAEVLLGAAAIPASVPPPACTLPMYSTRVKFQKITLGAGQHAFRMKGQFGVPIGVPPTFNPITQGALFFAQSSDGKAVVYKIPPGALGVGGCGPEDGWLLSGRNYKYLNESGALPPGCAAFSSGGLTKVQLRDERTTRSRIRFVIIAKDMDFLTTGVITTAAAEVGIGGYDVNGNPIACSSALLTCANGATTRSCRR